jgi:hypothetical protein
MLSQLLVLPLTNYLSSKTVRFYDVKANEQKSKYDHRAAVLACCFSDSNHAFSGGLDTALRSYVVMNYVGINQC